MAHQFRATTSLPVGTTGLRGRLCVCTFARDERRLRFCWGRAIAEVELR